MKMGTSNLLKELMVKYPQLSCCEADVEKAFEMLLATYQAEKKVLLCGNGGSASDCEHIVGELMKCFKKKRPICGEMKEKLSKTQEGAILAEVLEGGLKAISLTSHLSLSTAFANDREPSAVFAQPAFVLGDEGDTLIAISTSGNSKNCVYAATVAKAKGMKVLSMTGEKQSALSQMSDVCICVPEMETYKIQELHLPVYHCLCAMLENELF